MTVTTMRVEQTRTTIYGVKCLHINACLRHKRVQRGFGVEAKRPREESLAGAFRRTICTWDSLLPQREQPNEESKQAPHPFPPNTHTHGQRKNDIAPKRGTTGERFPFRLFSGTGHKRERRADRQPARTLALPAVSRVKHVGELGTWSLLRQEIWAVIFYEHHFTLKNYSHLSGNISVEIKSLGTLPRWLIERRSLRDGCVFRCRSLITCFGACSGVWLYVLFGMRNGVGELMILNWFNEPLYSPNTYWRLKKIHFEVVC